MRADTVVGQISIMTPPDLAAELYMFKCPTTRVIDVIVVLKIVQ